MTRTERLTHPDWEAVLTNCIFYFFSVMWIAFGK